MPTALRPCFKYEHKQSGPLGSATDTEPKAAPKPLEQPFGAAIRSPDGMEFHSKIVKKRA